ncbi:MULTISPECIES: hypothetical protein [Brevundimonas]|uniref:hypothetical protein n=1 Tax=Brevundimonas TaxID=41275 RepID=UPI0025C5404F|nr:MULTISPECIES: hypothetical protein [Brevundimonas]
MILSILTGGIDLPKLSTEVASLRLAVEETNAALADHIVKANARMTTIEGVVSDNVETLRMKLDRLDSEIENCTFGDAREREDGFTPRGLSGVVSDLSIGFYRQAGEIEALKKQVEALTAAKLSEVKARKAPKKSG